MAAILLVAPAMVNAQLLEESGLIGGAGRETASPQAFFERPAANWTDHPEAGDGVHLGPQGVPAETIYDAPPQVPLSQGIPQQGLMPSETMPGSWPEPPSGGGPLFGPGSYIPEPPHRRLGRFLGQGFIDLFHHPPVFDHDLMQPLLRESWLYRPCSISWFGGMMSGTELVKDWAAERQGYFFGYRFGWDLDDFWGVETRLGWGSVAIVDSEQAKLAQQAADDAAGIPPDSPWRDRFNHQRDTESFVWDVDLLYYPRGDVPFRPYVLIGLGVSDVYFLDRLSVGQRQNRLGLPLAIGWKWRCQECLAWRIELADNMGIGFGEGTDLLHQFSITAAIEVRLGGTRKAYWPWNPGRYYW
jgi:hypothetical protein